MKSDRALDPNQAPLLVTNTRGSFVVSRVSQRDGRAPFGYTQCSPEDEINLLAELYRVLWQVSETSGWNLRCTSVSEAVGRMRSWGVEPRSVVLPHARLEEICGEAMSLEEAETLMTAQGYVAEAEGVQVLVADMPERVAFVTASPSLLGYYVRVDDYLGLQFLQVNKTVTLVG